MQRPGLIGFLLVALAVTLLIVVPLDSSWKWPTVMLLLITGFILLFVSAMRRPRRNWGGHGRGNEGGDVAPFGGGYAGASSKHRSQGDSGHGHHDGDGGDGGGDGGGGGD
jgi:hypothetical protein